MTCREFADFMADYLASELSADIRRRFDEHLRLCPNCERYLKGYEETIKLGKHAFDTADETALPPSVPDDLVKAILAARQHSPSK